MPDRILFFHHAERMPAMKPHHLIARPYADLLAWWRRFVWTGQEPIADETIDLEHWIEHACLLRALVDAVGWEGVEIAEDGADVDGRIIFGDVPYRRLAAMFAFRGTTPDWPAWSMVNAAEGYARNPAFIQHAGREVQLADGPGQGARPNRDLYTVAADMATRHDLLFVKTVAEPKTTPNIVIETDDGDIRTQLREGLNLQLVHYEGIHDAFIVQAYARMEQEMRLFVIDGRIVGRSRNSPHLTPLHAPVFGGPGNPWEQQAIRDFMEADPRLRDFVLDVALIDGTPGIVEVNAIANSGWFTVRPERVVRPVLERFGISTKAKTSDA